MWRNAGHLWSALTPEEQAEYESLVCCASKISGKKLVEYNGDYAEYVQRVADEVRFSQC